MSRWPDKQAMVDDRRRSLYDLVLEYIEDIFNAPLGSDRTDIPEIERYASAD